jgi:methyltransferase
MEPSLDTRVLYLGLVALVALERLVELAITRRHAARLAARGGVVAGQGHYRWMVLLHTSLLVAAPLETWALGRPFVPPLAAATTLLVVLSMTLRYWVIATLGDRWTTNVVVVPGEPPVEGGPYRFLRHPNYLAVVLEVAALPLVHTAWLTALAFSVANAFLLRRRIRVEEEALAAHSPYRERLGDRRRFLPGRPAPS